MSKIRSIVAAQSSVGEPEHRGDERSEAARSGGSPTFEPDVVPVVSDSEVQSPGHALMLRRSVFAF